MFFFNHMQRAPSMLVNVFVAASRRRTAPHSDWWNLIAVAMLMLLICSPARARDVCAPLQNENRHLASHQHLYIYACTSTRWWRLAASQPIGVWYTQTNSRECSCCRPDWGSSRWHKHALVQRTHEHLGQCSSAAANTYVNMRTSYAQTRCASHWIRVWRRASVPPHCIYHNLLRLFGSTDAIHHMHTWNTHTHLYAEQGASLFYSWRWFINTRAALASVHNAEAHGIANLLKVHTRT